MRRVLLIALVALVAVPTAFAATPATTTADTSTTTATDTTATDTTATSPTPATTTTPAATGPIFGLRAVGNPKLGYFVYPAAPGSVTHGSVIVTNTGDATGVVKLYTSDATTGSTTGAVYLTDKAPALAGSWIKLSSSRLTLPPGKQATVSFTVTVPSSAAPGQFVGGVVAETVAQVAGPKSQEKANVQIKVRNLSIVAVQVNVPGPKISKFTIGKATIGGSKGFQQVIVHIANDGNVLAKPSGAVTIHNTSGLPIQTIKFRMDTFLPHTSIDYPIVLTKGLPPGNYTASVTLSYPNAAGVTQTVAAAPALKVSQASVSQVFKSSSPTKAPSGTGSSSKSSSSSTLKTYGPYVAGALILLLLLLVLILLLSSRRSRTPPAARPGPEQPAAPEAPAASVPMEAPPVVPLAAPVAPPPPSPPPAVSSSDPCVPHHYWEVLWDQGRPGPNGVTLYPHRCRTCGIQVLATDINDAADQAAVRRGGS